MRLLLDTHIVLWALLGDSALPTFASRALVDSANLRFVSVASLWEVAIKRSTGKLAFPLDPVEFTRRVQQDLRAQVLPIEASHLQVLEHLPWHHRDPSTG